MIARKLFSIAVSLLAFVHLSAFAGFNFGDLTQDGSGSFNQSISKSAFVDVGTVPVGVNNLTVSLKSDKDVDIQLWDIDANKPIVGWDVGALIGSLSTYEKTTYNGVTIEYSGYNGDGNGRGHEYIKLTGVTKNKFLIKAFGYVAGTALVNYSWKGISSNGENSTGNGSFSQYINKDSKVQLDGTIPSGVSNVTISLQAADDIDVELYDAKTGAFVVGWNGGKISNSTYIKGIHNGDVISWSGWNGRAYDYGENMLPSDGYIPPSEFGREWIKISGTLKNSYIMKVFGFKSGKASVNYSWGNNLIYAGIAGTGPKKADSNTQKMIFDYRNGMSSSSASGHRIKADGYIDSDYTKIANTHNWGVLGIALRISTLTQGGGDIIVFNDGNATSTFLNLKSKIDESFKKGGVTNEFGSKVYISGHSNGGGDAKDISWKFKELNYNIRSLFLIDAIFEFPGFSTNLFPSVIPSNVRNAVCFYESDLDTFYDFAFQKDLTLENQYATTESCTQIKNPVGGVGGDSSSGSSNFSNTAFGSADNAHNRIDNDPRVWSEIIKFITIDFSSFQKGFGNLTFL